MGQSLEATGNQGNPNKIGAFNQSVGIGTAVKLGAMTIDGDVSTNTLGLGDGFRANTILRCFVSAGGATGEFTPVTGPAPAAGEVGITIRGNIVFNAADAVTRAEVTYFPLEGDKVERRGIVDAGLVTLPDPKRVRMLVEASVAGASRVIVARGTAPAAGQAAISTDGRSVVFNVADNGDEAVFEYVEMPENSVVQKLQSEVAF